MPEGAPHGRAEGFYRLPAFREGSAGGIRQANKTKSKAQSEKRRVMHKFTGNDGHEWGISLNSWTAREVKKATGVDLLDLETLTAKLAEISPNE